MITERQCKQGIVIGLILAMGIPILLTLVPFAFIFASIATETAHESLVHDIRILELLRVVRDVIGIVGTLILVPSWILLKRRRKQEKLR